MKMNNPYFKMNVSNKDDRNYYIETVIDGSIDLLLNYSEEDVKIESQLVYLLTYNINIFKQLVMQLLKTEHKTTGYLTLKTNSTLDLRDGVDAYLSGIIEQLSFLMVVSESDKQLTTLLFTLMLNYQSIQDLLEQKETGNDTGLLNKTF